MVSTSKQTRSLPLWLKRMVAAVLCIFVFITAFSQPVYAMGQVHWYVQTTIDTEHWLVAGSVVQDEVVAGIFGVFTEGKRIHSDDLKSLNDNSADLSNADQRTTIPAIKSQSGLTLTFPGARNIPANNADLARAQMVVDYLMSDLNKAIRLCWSDEERARWDKETFVSNMTALAEAAEGSGRTTVGNGTIASVSEIPASILMDSSVSSGNYRAITVDGQTYYVLVSFPKGYTQSLKGMSPSVDEPANIYWRTLLWEAIHNYSLIGDAQVDINNVYEDENIISKTLSGTLVALCNGVRSILNLWSADELIYNAGVRGTDEYVYGIFPSVWEPYIWMMFALFEVIAVLLLLYSIITTVTKRALATANAMGKRKAWEQVRQLIIVAMLLTALPLIMQLLLSFSSSLSGIFYSALGGKTIVDTRRAVGVGGGLTGAIVQVIFLGMDVYFNFFYMLRSLAIAILFAVSPLCIIAMTFDSWVKNIPSVWLKELTVNVFLQPIHAFLFVFVCLLPGTGHGFDKIILMYAIIPFTTTLRNIFFGGAGGALEQAAKAAKKTVMGGVGGAAAIGTALAASSAAKGFSSFGKGFTGGTPGSGTGEAVAAAAAGKEADAKPAAAEPATGAATGPDIQPSTTDNLTAATAADAGSAPDTRSAPDTSAAPDTSSVPGTSAAPSVATAAAATAAAARNDGAGFWSKLGHGMLDEAASAQGGLMNKSAAGLGYGAGYLLGKNGLGAYGERLRNSNDGALRVAGTIMSATSSVTTTAATKAAPYIAPVAGVGLATVGSIISGTGGGGKAIGDVISSNGFAMCRGSLSGIKAASGTPGTPTPAKQA